MKKFITTFIAIISFVAIANAQADNFAELRNSVLHLKNGITLRTDDILVLGNATGCYENCFEYIFHEPAEMIPQLTHQFTKNVYASYSGNKVSIKKIKQITKNKEKIWLLTLTFRERKETFYCYLEQAFNAGEIILTPQTNNWNAGNNQSETKPAEQKIPEQPAQTLQPNDQTKPNFSVADEIRKLKALLDEGVITNEEFEKLKAKLLE